MTRQAIHKWPCRWRRQWQSEGAYFGLCAQSRGWGYLYLPSEAGEALWGAQFSWGPLTLKVEANSSEKSNSHSQKLTTTYSIRCWGFHIESLSIHVFVQRDPSCPSNNANSYQEQSILTDSFHLKITMLMIM